MSRDEKPEFRLRISPSGRFQFAPGAGGEFQDAKLRPCFPLSDPLKWFSIHDGEGHELGLVAEPSDLEAESKAALESALATGGFLIEIRKIEAIESEHDIRNWKVLTPGGPRCFQTRMGSWPRKLDDGGVLVQDVAEDLYLIRDAEQLDAESRRILWAFSD